MAALRLLAVLALACACAPLEENHNPGPEVWAIYIDPALRMDPDVILVHVDALHGDWAITFYLTDVDPDCAVGDAAANVLCIYARSNGAVLGMAIRDDPGNRRREVNCGKLGVFAGTLDTEYEVAAVAAHEIGHSLGLAHPAGDTPGDLMNSHFWGSAHQFSDRDRDYLFAVLGPR